MAIKVEVVTPVTSVSEVVGQSAAITVVRSAVSPITTDNAQAVVDVVAGKAIASFPVQQEAPSSPYEGMIWLSYV